MESLGPARERKMSLANQDQPMRRPHVHRIACLEKDMLVRCTPSRFCQRRFFTSFAESCWVTLFPTWKLVTMFGDSTAYKSSFFWSKSFATKPGAYFVIYRDIMWPPRMKLAGRRSQSAHTLAGQSSKWTRCCGDWGFFGQEPADSCERVGSSLNICKSVQAGKRKEKARNWTWEFLFSSAG